MREINTKQTKRALTLLLCAVMLAACLAQSGCIRFKPYISSKSLNTGDATATSAAVTVTVKNPTNKAVICTVTAKVHWAFGGGCNGNFANAEGSRDIEVAPKSQTTETITVSHSVKGASRTVKLKKVTISGRRAAGGET